MRRRFPAFVAVLVACSGGAPSGARLTVRVVTAPETGGDVTSLELSAWAGTRELQRVFVEAGGAPLAFPVEAQLTVSAAATEVTAVARSASGDEVDRGESPVAAGQHTVEVALSRPPPPGRVSASPGWQAFSPTTVGMTSEPLVVVLTNLGHAPTAPVSLSLSADTGDFLLEGCVGEAIATGASCELSVRFRPLASGSRRLDAGLFTVVGQGVDAASLTVRVANGQHGDRVDFLDQQCAGECSVTLPASRVVTLRAVTGGGSELAGWSAPDCPGRSDVCLVPVSGARTVTATFETVARPLFVDITGPGAVCYDEPAFGKCCADSCVWWFPQGTRVALTTSAGQGAGLVSLEGDCTPSGPGACDVAVGDVQRVAADFDLLNVAFVATQPLFGPISLARADQECSRQRPSGPSSTVYRAWLSLPGQPAAERFAGVLGWQTTTRERITDDLDMLLRGELERAVSSVHHVYATGTLADGGVGDTCSGWTSTSPNDVFTAGESTLSTVGWTEARTAPCNQGKRLLCLGVSSRARPRGYPQMPANRRVFVSRAVVRGDSAAAEAPGICAAEAADAGLGPRVFEPVLIHSNWTLKDYLSHLGGYRRVDGVQVFSSSDLDAPGNLTAWGEHLGLEPVWFGGSSVSSSEPPTPEESCAEWDGGVTGRAMFAPRQGNYQFINQTFLLPCDAGAHVFCAEGPH